MNRVNCYPNFSANKEFYIKKTMNEIYKYIEQGMRLQDIAVMLGVSEAEIKQMFSKGELKMLQYKLPVKRVANVEKLFNEGVSINEIAGRMKLNPRTVSKILLRQRAEAAKIQPPKTDAQIIEEIMKKNGISKEKLFMSVKF